MHQPDILTTLQRILPQADFQSVIHALRYDSLIWESLQDEVVFHGVLNFAGKNSTLWTAANLGMFGLFGNKVTASELSSEPLVPLEDTLKNRVVTVFEQYLGEPDVPDSFPTAVLLALALRERRRLLGTWDGLLRELVDRQKLSDHRLYEIWKTPFACLCGLIPDPAQMNDYLLSGNDASPELGIMLVTHILLSNPYSLENRASEFMTYLRDIPSARRVNWLRDLSLQGQTELAKAIAERLLAEKEGGFEGYKKSLYERDVEQSFSAALEMQENAILNFLVGRPEVSKLMLNEARQIVQYWLAGLSIQMASVADNENTAKDVISDFSQYLQLVPDVGQLKGEFCLATGVDASEIEQMDFINNEQDTPWLMLRKSFAISRQGSINQARELARRAVQNLAAEIKSDTNILESRFLLGWQPAAIIRKLVDLDLPLEARQLCSSILVRRPSDPELVKLAVDLAYQSGEMTQALKYAQIGTLLDPNKPDAYRKLAELWEETGDWEKSFEQRQQVLRLVENPEVHDWWSFAHSAFNVNQVGLASDTCQVILEAEQDHGLAHALRGKALVLCGNWEEAEKNLTRATELVPKDESSWIYLSEAYHRKGKSVQALETLRVAAANLPDSSQINHKLAKYCVENGLNSEALHYSRKASALAPDDVNIAIQLGDILHSIGYFGEAREILENLLENNPKDPDLAYTFSKILLASNSDEDVTHLLECAIQKEPPEIDRFLLFAQTMMGDENLAISEKPLINPERLQKAQYALEKALKLQPDHFDALLLLSETHKLNGDLQKSYKLYKKLGESLEAGNPTNRHRIQAGLGQVALKLGHVDTALVALQESVQVTPKNGFLNRLLADAYQLAGLMDDSFETALHTLELNPDDADNIAWFAEKMVKLGRFGEAINAFQKLAGLTQDNVHYLLKIAELELKKLDTEAARETLKTILKRGELSSDILYSISGLSLKAGDEALALDCLEKAFDCMDGSCKRDLIIELIGLQKNFGKLDRAVTYIEKAIAAFDNDLSLRILLVDLLSESNRPDEAIACLEEAVKLISKEPESLESYLWIEENVNGASPSGWYEKTADPAGIYLRLSMLFRQIKNLTLAYHYVVKAYEIEPNNPEICYLVADLEHSLLLDDDKNYELAFSSILPGGTSASHSPALHNFSDALQNLRMILVERALARNELGQVEQIISKEFETDPEHPGFIAANVRLLARKFYLDEARSHFSQLLAACRQKYLSQPEPVFNWGNNRQSEINKKWKRWLAEAGLDIGLWDEAVTLFEEYKYENLYEPEALVGYARCLAVCAEKEKLLTTVKCTKAKPGTDKIGQKNFKQFTKAIEGAENIGATAEVLRWRARGNLAFDPTTQHIKELYRVQKSAEDAGALVMGLRSLNQGAKAIQAAHRFIDDPEVLIQMALCYQDNTRQLIVDYATRAVERAPQNPIYQAVCAFASEKSGNMGKALSAIEKALEVMPEEPEWHAWAARMAGEVGQDHGRVDHLEKAVSIDPLSVGYKLALGEALLDVGNAENAIFILEPVVDTNHRQVNHLVALSKAYRMTGQLKKAFEYCERACQLETGAQLQVMCAEVAFEMEKPNLALEYARKAYEKNPEDAVILLFLVRILKNLNRNAEALESLEKFGASAPLPVLLERAKLCLSVRGPKEALPVFETIVGQYPDNIEALEMLAQTLAVTGKLDDAAKAAFVALRINPEQPGLNQLVGQIHRQTGQLDQAIHYLSEAIRQNPCEIEAYLMLGEAYQERREYSKALKVYQQANSKIQGDPRPYYEAAMILKYSKDYAGAEVMLRQAAERAPDDLEIRRQLAPLVAQNLVQNSREVKFSS